MSHNSRHKMLATGLKSAKLGIFLLVFIGMSAVALIYVRSSQLIWMRSLSINEGPAIRKIAPITLLDQLILEKVPQDDPRLVQIIKEQFLQSGSTRPYKFTYFQGPQVEKIITPQSKIISNLFKGKKGGVLFDCGAYDGQYMSNSLYLEAILGWRGVLVEADHDIYNQLIGKNRRSNTMNACLSPQPHPIKGKFQEDIGQVGHLVSGKTARYTEVYCFPVYSILLALGQTHIDYFSLDVEGQELNVLKTIPWDKVDITSWSVEYKNIPNGGPSALREYMKEQGYVVHIDVRTVAKPGLYDDYIFVKKGWNVTEESKTS